MIKLNKGDPPQILVDKGEEWTTEYAAYLSGEPGIPESAKTRYRHPEIKARIKLETAEKCAYCESKVPHVSPGDVEHIVPKSKVPARVCDWANLTFVCTECNRRKRDYHSESEPLVNPYEDDPADHFRFFGPMLLHLDLDKARRTKLLLELCRKELFERRKEKLERVQSLLDNFHTQSAGPTRDLLREQVLLEAATDREYSATARDFLDALGMLP